MIVEDQWNGDPLRTCEARIGIIMTDTHRSSIHNQGPVGSIMRGVPAFKRPAVPENIDCSELDQLLLQKGNVVAPLGAAGEGWQVSISFLSPGGQLFGGDDPAGVQIRYVIHDINDPKFS